MKLLIIFPLLLISGGYAFFKIAGPYEVTIDGLTDCEDVGSGLVRHTFRVRKVNKTTRLLQGRADFKIPFDDKMSYDVKTSEWVSGGWGRNAFTLVGKDFCSMYHRALGEIFVNFYNALKVPPQCPIPAGVYDMETGMELIYKKLKSFPVLEYGRFKTELKFLLGKEVVGCINILHRAEEVAG